MAKQQRERASDIVKACVPYGTAEKLARQVGRHVGTVNRWGRAPRSDDNPSGTGEGNPLEIVEALQDHAFAHAPKESHRIHLYFQRRWEQFTAAFTPKVFTPEQRDKEISDVVREHGQLLSAVLEKLPPDRVRAEWEQLKREGEELVRLIEANSHAALNGHAALGENFLRGESHDRHMNGQNVTAPGQEKHE